MSDIVWNPLPQTNFTGSNQMTQLAMQAWDDAFKRAEDTLKNANSAITNRNEADIASFINSVPKELWGTEESNKLIDDYIATTAKKTGNMFDPKVIEAYRDGRGSTLLARDNARLQNEESTLAWQNKQLADSADKTAQELVVYDSVIQNTANPIEQQQAQIAKDALLERIYSDSVFAGLVEQAKTKQLTDRYLAHDKLADAQMLPDVSAITSLSSQLYEAHIQKTQLLQNPPSANATQEQKEAYQAKLTKVNEAISTTSGLLETYKERHGAGKVTQVYDKLVEDMSKKHYELYGTPKEQQAFRLKQVMAEHAAAIAAGRLDLDTQKFGYQIEQDGISNDFKAYELTQGGGGGSKEGDASAKTLSDHFGGIQWKNADGSLNGGALNTAIHTRLNDLTKDTVQRELPEFTTKEPYSEWETQHLHDLAKRYGAHWNGTYSGFMRFADTLGNYETQTDTGSRRLTDWEKQTILINASKGNIPIGESGERWFIEQQLANLEAERKKVAKDKQTQYLTDSFLALSNAGYDGKQIAQALGLSSQNQYFKQYPEFIQKSVLYLEKQANAPKGKGVLKNTKNPVQPLANSVLGIPVVPHLAKTPTPYRIGTSLNKANVPTVGQYVKGKGEYVPR